LKSLDQGACDAVLAVHQGGANSPQMPPESGYWNIFFQRLLQMDVSPNHLVFAGKYGVNHPIWSSLPESSQDLDAIFDGQIALYPFSIYPPQSVDDGKRNEMLSVKSALASPFEPVLESACEQPNPNLQAPQFRWSKMKHEIVRQFLAFDTDLQVWEEEEFKDAVRKETIEHYGGTLIGRLARTKSILYGDSSSSVDSIEKVLCELGKSLPLELASEVRTVWQEVNGMLPPHEAKNELIESITRQLDSGDKGDFEPLVAGMKGNGETRFCDWNHGIADALFRLEYLILARQRLQLSRRTIGRL
jgi:hypothetical protein